MRQTVVWWISLCLVHFTRGNRQELYTNTWALQIDGGEEEANRIADKYGYINLGQIGSLKGIFHFRHKSHPLRSRRSLEDETNLLYDETTVRWAEQQTLKRRVKREYRINDPYFPFQWYLHNTNSPYQGYDHNVLPVWKEGVYGKNVVVSILDDGIETTHKDLAPNYDAKASYDYNSNDNDPTPRKTWNNENRHGTRCAGEVAAVFNNSFCVVGVAPKARIGGVRMLDGEVTDAVEASSLSLRPQHIDIYSASWGPDDDGKTVDGPGALAKHAFNNGITQGRSGLGSIYVWASGNGGHYSDNCNCDGYTNSIFTLSISSATEHGGSPWYSEACSSTLATAFSSGSFGMRKVVTTDLNGKCTRQHTGTSASAPIAAGILALALEVNRNLTWRDMQHLVVRSSKMDKLHAHDVETNGVGRKVSHKFGYGLLDAAALVRLARIWKTAPPQHVCHEIPDATQRLIPNSGTLTVSKKATGCAGTSNEVKYLEHVEAVISLSFSKRGDLVIYLTSPKGTRSVLLAQRLRDYDKRGFTNWAFMTTHSWEENPVGEWTLEIANLGTPLNNGSLKNWSMRFYGTAEEPNRLETRRTQPAVTACDVECKGGCTGPLPDNCNSCAHFKRKTTGECVSSCSKHEYADGKVCKPCSSTCNACDGPTSSNCASCLSPLLLMNNKCIDTCLPSWFKSKGRCIKCDSTCKTCVKTATQCTSCKKLYKLVGTRCQHDCPTGKFVVNAECVACHPSCLECTKPGPQGCTKCGVHKGTKGDNPLHFYRGACLKTCPSGTYGDAVSQQCKSCSSSCSTCSGPRVNDCLSCSIGLYRVGDPHGFCRKICPPGYVADLSHGKCTKCSSSCMSCNQGDPSKCTSCYKAKYLDNGKCVSPQNCSVQTYPSDAFKTCKKCNSDCLTCSGPAENQCTLCGDGYCLYQSRCVLRCPAKTFPSKQSCQDCPQHCTSCYGRSTNECLACEHSLSLSGSECVSKCPVNTFKHQPTNTCLKCHPSCQTCNGGSSGNCLSCKDGYTLNKTSCLAKCPEGEVFTKKGCSKCHSSCLACSGPSNKDCVSCKGVKFLDLTTNMCTYQCPDGYYGQVKTAICKPCQTGCKTCHEPGKCVTCKAGLVLNEKVCQPQCPMGMYLNKHRSTCEKCDSSCLECSDAPHHCIKCHTHKILSEKKCVDICSTGFFHEKQSHTCQKCHKSCAKCSGPQSDECVKCKSSYLKSGKMCVKSCPSGYFHNVANKQCDICDYYCQVCKDGNGLQNCSKCIPPFVLYTHYCVRECPVNGWYLDTRKNACIKCHSSCKRCIGPTANECITCSKPSAVLNGFICQLQCPKGFFKNLKTHQCQKCHPTCGSCTGSGPGSCTSCAHGLVLYKSNGPQGKCLSTCNPGYYRSKSSKCLPCQNSCKTCYGSTKTTCLSCQTGHVYFQNTCQRSCPSGTFLLRTLQRCFQCHPLCKTCYGASPKKCTSCLSTFLLEDSTCVIKCSSKSIPDLKNKVCKPCRNCPRQPGKPKNRSVQDPTLQTLRFLLDDPHKNGLFTVVILFISLCVLLFFVVLGVLQLRSTRHLCFKREYTIIKADFDQVNEDEKALMDGDLDFDDEA